VIELHDHRAIAHPNSALSWENASRDAHKQCQVRTPKLYPVLTTGSTA
jgi:predicted secreted Zn-dependent protease